MRPVLVLFLLVLPLSASAEVVTGRTHIFFHDAWAPVAGGPLTSLGLPIESVAYDGERFLAAWRDTEAVRLGLFEEGATTSIATAALEAAPGKPFVRWDGSRYVVIIASSPAQLAIVSRQGVVELRTTIPATRDVVDVAASSAGIALATRYTSDTHANLVDVLLLDSTYRVATRTTVGSILNSTGFGITYIDWVVLAPFGNGFYVAWEEGRTARWDDIVGTRVLPGGSAPDVVPSRHEQRSLTGTLIYGTTYSHPRPYAVHLHPFGSRLLMSSLREHGYGLVTSLVDQDGRSTPPIYELSLFSLPITTRTVRLTDGSIALVYAKGGVATVTTLMRAGGPRRRTARH
jgi:hypothetical protein